MRPCYLIRPCGSQLRLTYRNKSGRTYVIERQHEPMHSVRRLIRTAIEHHLRKRPGGRRVPWGLQVPEWLVDRVCRDRKVNVRNKMRINASTLDRLCDQ